MVWNKLCAYLLFQIFLENQTNHLHVNVQLIHHNLRDTDIMVNTLAHLLLQYHSQPVLNIGQLQCLEPVFTSMYYTLFELVFQRKVSMAHAHTDCFQAVLALTIRHISQSCIIKQHINFFNEKCFLLVSHICTPHKFSNLMLHCKIFHHYKAEKQYHL